MEVKSISKMNKYLYQKNRVKSTVAANIATTNAGKYCDPKLYLC